MYKYNINDARVSATSQLFITDIRIPHGITFNNDEIVFPNNFRKFTFLNVSDLTIEKEIESNIFRYYSKINDNKLFYIDAPLSNLNSIDLQTNEDKIEYSLNRKVQSTIHPEIGMDVIGNSIVAFDENSESNLSLVRHNWSEDARIWKKDLIEFDDSSAPNKIHSNNVDVIIMSDNKISCRALLDGNIKWNKSLTEMTNPFYVKLIDSILLVADEYSMYAFNVQDGALKWEIEESTGGLIWGSKIDNIVHKENLVFINLIPINLDNGQILWNPIFTLGADAFDRALNKMDFDIHKGIAYYIIDNVLYQLKL